MASLTSPRPRRTRSAPRPDLATSPDGDYITGLDTIDDRMLILVDIDRLMASDDIGLADRLAA